MAPWSPCFQYYFWECLIVLLVPNSLFKPSIPFFPFWCFVSFQTLLFVCSALWNVTEMRLGRDPSSFFVSFMVQKLRPSNSGIYLFLYYLLISSLLFSVPSFCTSLSQTLHLLGEPVIFLSFLFFFFSVFLIFVILAEGFPLVNCPKISIKFFSFPKVFFFFLHFTRIKLINTSITSHSSFFLCVCVVRTLKICSLSKFQVSKTGLLTIITRLCIRAPRTHFSYNWIHASISLSLPTLTLWASLEST